MTAYQIAHGRAAVQADRIIASVAKEREVNEEGGNDPVWKTMDSAPQEAGVEVIAARFCIYGELTSMCEKSPFISFWMQTRRKFYGDPTHWLCRVPLSFPPISPTAAP